MYKTSISRKFLGDEDRVNRKFGGYPAAGMSAVKISTKALGDR